MILAQNVCLSQQLLTKMFMHLWNVEVTFPDFLFI